MKKNIKAMLIFLILPCFLYAQQKSSILFYPTESNLDDSEVIESTQNLLFSQMQEFKVCKIIDNRDSTYSKDNVDSVAEYQFFSTIDNINDKWECTLKLVHIKTQKEASWNRTYDTYYRILIESKSAMMNMLYELKSSLRSSSVKDSALKNKNISSIEDIAGTWNAEEHINKILILKSGKGFIFFKNGSTMNIEAKIQDGLVIIDQTSTQNESFFKDEITKEKAKNSKGFEWVFDTAQDNSVIVQCFIITQSNAKEFLSYETWTYQY